MRGSLRLCLRAASNLLTRNYAGQPQSEKDKGRFDAALRPLEPQINTLRRMLPALSLSIAL
jgi:hypothetical protein